jgi:hypothetical protein
MMLILLAVTSHAGALPRVGVEGPWCDAIELLLQGASNREIARRLGMSEHAIRGWRKQPELRGGI